MNMVTRKEISAAATVSDPRWAAVLARNPKADGDFVYPVNSTGVYGRPSCAARAARPENVAFHATPGDAERAGFRPCKRCKPDQLSLASQHAARVAGLCRFIENAEELPTLDELAQRARLSAYHLHRVFTDVTGLTPKAYANAQRAKRVRRELGSSATVSQASYGAGHNSQGRFYEASNPLLGMTTTRHRAGVSLWRQPARGGDSLPSRGAQRRRAVWLSLGRGAQAHAARARGVVTGDVFSASDAGIQHDRLGTRFERAR